MPFPETHSLLLGDRTLTWCEYGSNEGFPVFYFHGTPGSRWQVPPEVPASARLIAFDRPGYGGSSLLSAPRPLTGIADDVRALTEHLGITAFSCIGVSGGAAFAAATAQVLPVQRLVLCCPVGNPRAPGALDEMGFPNRALFWALMNARWLGQCQLRLEAWVLQQAERGMNLLANALPAPDRQVLDYPPNRTMFLESLKEAMRPGGAGHIAENWSFFDGWDVDPQQITCPTEVFLGKLDQNVSPGMVRQWRADRTHAYEAEGHLCFVTHWPEILAAATGEHP